MNNEALPEQYAPVVTIDQLKLEKTFLIGGFHFENNLTIQKNSGEDQIHLAPLFTLHSLFYQHKFFSNKMLTDIGVNAAYNSEYYADNFMPSTGLFYRQDEMKTEGYLRFDLFLRIKIKSARIFLKMENINDNMQKSAYYLTPHYPQPGKVFRFGLVWRFFDQ
ncbi:MAG: TonB-dependent receptor [Bacteroidetes bacterium]|nr:TonB-dependent receptor [Bacteroidota bacterium]